MFDKQKLPTLGVGLSFRTEVGQDIISNLDAFDFLELIAETGFSNLLPDNFDSDVLGHIPIISHGVSSSIGSLDETYIPTEHLIRVKQQLTRLQSPWFSEHLAFTKALGVDAGQLLPIQRSKLMVSFVANKIKHMAVTLDIPILIENLAYYFEIPGAEMDEVDFIFNIIQDADCGLLLDLNNLYANCLNHGLDPFSFIKKLPEERIVEVHMAGGEEIDNVYIDSHGHPINSQVFELLDYVCRTKKPKAVVLEREKNIPSIDHLIDEVTTIKSIWQGN